MTYQTAIDVSDVEPTTVTRSSGKYLKQKIAAVLVFGALAFLGVSTFTPSALDTQNDIEVFMHAHVLPATSSSLVSVKALGKRKQISSRRQQVPATYASVENGSDSGAEVSTEAAVKTRPSSAKDGEFWVNIVSEAEFGNFKARRKVFSTGLGKKIVLLWFKQEIYAIDYLCPHLGVPLDNGRLSADGTITCDQHGSSWKLENGNVASWLPGDYFNRLQRMVTPETNLEVYPVVVEDGQIWVNLEGASLRGDISEWTMTKGEDGR